MQPQSLTTTKALLIHELRKYGLNALTEIEAPRYNHQSSVSLTVHDIKSTDKGAVMGAGRIMSEADKQELKDFLNGEHSIRDCWLPENLMMMNSTQMVWYVPAKKRPMYFGTGSHAFSVEVMWPSLIFCQSSGTLNVAAYAGKGRPKLTQKLYHAPLWNVYSTTRLCSGSADTTSIIGLDAMKVWEEAIFNTNFTHSNHSNVIARHTKSERYASVSDKHYQRFIKNKAKSGEPFRVSEMVPLNVTLENWAGRKD